MHYITSNSARVTPFSLYIINTKTTTKCPFLKCLRVKRPRAINRPANWESANCLNCISPVSAFVQETKTTLTLYYQLLFSRLITQTNFFPPTQIKIYKLPLLNCFNFVSEEYFPSNKIQNLQIYFNSIFKLFLVTCRVMRTVCIHLIYSVYRMNLPIS